VIVLHDLCERLVLDAGDVCEVAVGLAVPVAAGESHDLREDLGGRFRIEILCGDDVVQSLEARAFELEVEG
jgi:hypothetical protein